MSSRNTEKLEKWRERYRLENPLYNLTYNAHPIWVGVVAGFMSSFVLGVIDTNPTFVTRWAFLISVIAGFADYYLIKEPFYKAESKFIEDLDL